jgi:hypothetical protein
MRFSIIFSALCCLTLVALQAGGEPSASGAAQATDKLVYADFETIKEGRALSSGGGVVQIITYQERPTLESRFKGAAGTNAPELVRLSKDDPNRAAAFDYELQAPNQYAGVGLEVGAKASEDGKPVALDVSGYKDLMLQLYVTGVESIRVEFVSRGQGMNLSSGYPQLTFKVKPGLNTYKVPLKSISQPSWAEVKVSPKDVLKKLTAINVFAFCDQCKPTRGTVVVDNLVFQN